MLICSKCYKEHNLDEFPDEGYCIYCGYALIDLGEKYPPSIKSSFEDLLMETHLKLNTIKRIKVVKN